MDNVEETERLDKNQALAIGYLLISSSLLWIFFGIFFKIHGAIYGGGFALAGYLTAIFFIRSDLKILGKLIYFISAGIAILYGAFTVPGGGYILLMLLGLCPITLIIFSWRDERRYIFATVSTNIIAFAVIIYLYPEKIFYFDESDIRSHVMVVILVCVSVVLVAGLAIYYSVAATVQKSDALKVAQSKLKAALSEVEWLAFNDELTGIHSRRWLMSRFADRVRKKDVALVIVDIDHFKSVNDVFGHFVGDEYLKAVGALLKEKTETMGCAVRLGGEEFTIIWPWTVASSINDFLESIREDIAKIIIDFEGNKVQRTASIGFTKLTMSEKLVEGMRRADKALYAAKHEGRNKVVGVGV